MVAATNSEQLSRLARDLAADPSVRNVFALAPDNENRALELLQTHYPVQHSLARAQVAVSAYLALAVRHTEGEGSFFPTDWLEPSGTANADFVMSCVLCQLTNYSYAVLRLVSLGLDTPARALLRATADLCYATAVLAVDREAFQQYVLDESRTAKEQWFRLFSARKLSQRLQKVESLLGVPKEWTNEFMLFRTENTEFFSEAVHHSKRAVTVGTLPRIHGTDRVEFALLGGSPSASGSTLRHLVEVMNYANSVLVASPRSRPSHVPGFDRPELWNAATQILGRAQSIFLEARRADG